MISLATDGVAYCGVLSSSDVDCWGDGDNGELGDGEFYWTGYTGSDVPVKVVGVGGSGTLSGVASLTGSDVNFCALLSSGGVDCWGNGEDGSLGNGLDYSSSPYGSDVPVAVLAPSGSGYFTGATGLVADTLDTYCAVTAPNSNIYCWGQDSYGQVGSGSFDGSGEAIPSEVILSGGQYTLNAEQSLVAGVNNFCAVTVGGFDDCWGEGAAGALGDGDFYSTSPWGSSEAVAVNGAYNSLSLTGNAGGFCAHTMSDTVECWGGDESGELGNGEVIASSPYGVSSPVDVVGVGGEGTL